MFVQTLVMAAAVLFVSFMSNASASTLNAEIGETARVGYSRAANVGGEMVRFIHVGVFDGCDAVSILDKHIQNYRVCAGKVIARNTVSPAWHSSDGRQTFAEVQKMALDRGQYSMLDPNGYLIDIHQMSETRRGCWKYEVVISYNGDLVERDQIHHCNK